MTNETVPTSDPTATNGRPAGESVVERAKRVLGGDIRPTDYLTLPPEAAEKVEWEFRTALALRPGGILTETEKHRMRQNRALEYHYGCRWVAALRTDAGVIVLASGEEDLTAFYRGVPEDLRHAVHFEFPTFWE